MVVVQDLRVLLSVGWLQQDTDVLHYDRQLRTTVTE